MATINPPNRESPVAPWVKESMGNYAAGVGVATLGRSYVTMTASDGSEWELTSDLSDLAGGIAIQPGPTGLAMPPAVVAYEDQAQLDGGAINKARFSARVIQLPVVLYAPGREMFMALHRALRRALNPRLGPVVLRIRESTGLVRTISAHYNGGFEGDEGNAGRNWCRVGLSFICPDPFFYATDQWQRFALTGGSPMLSPKVPGTTKFLPLRISPSILSEAGTRLESLSDVDAWPRWKIFGPLGPGVTLANLTTGQSLKINTTLLAGEFIEVDTRPGEKRVELIRSNQSRENLWPLIDSPASLWPLEPGVNTIGITVAGASASSAVELTYSPRLLGY